MLTVDVLRALMRNLLGFRALYESEGKDTITGPGGIVWCLWDLEHIYEIALRDLPPRQAQSIELFLVHNFRESDVAEMMSLSPTNPIGMYATAGLERVLEWIEEGRLPRFHLDAWSSDGTNEVRDS